MPLISHNRRNLDDILDLVLVSDAPKILKGQMNIDEGLWSSSSTCQGTPFDIDIVKVIPVPSSDLSYLQAPREVIGTDPKTDLAVVNRGKRVVSILKTRRQEYRKCSRWWSRSQSDVGCGGLETLREPRHDGFKMPLLALTRPR